MTSFQNLAIAVLIASASLTWANSFIADGQVAGTIVLSTKASEVEELAASELASILKKITQVSVSVDKSDESGATPSIYIGNHPGNQKFVEILNKQYPKSIDAFCVVSDKSGLHLVGRSQTSTVWACWEFLEKLGVAWIMPGEKGVFIPKKTSVDIDGHQIFEAPRIAFRGAFYHQSPSFPNVPEGMTRMSVYGVSELELFNLRMRMNQNLALTEADEFAVLGAGHSYQIFLPVAEYFSRHPEWFAAKKGKRFDGYGWQICSTSSGAAEEFSRNAEKAIGDTMAKGISADRIRLFVSPNDQFAFCDCKECAKIIESGGNASDLIVNFANLVAKRVHLKHPEVSVIFYAYDNYSLPSQKIKPASGVYPQLTAWPSDNSFGVNNAKPLMSSANRKFKDSFYKWSEFSDGLSLYTYYGHYNWFTPFPMLTQMPHDLNIMAQDTKFNGAYSESNWNWGSQGITFWLFPKLLWNPQLDVPQALKVYCDAAYGPASGLFQEYLQTLQDAMDAQGYIAGTVYEIPSVLSPNVIEKCNALMAKAEESFPKMDEGQLWRAKVAVEGWKFSAKYAQAVQIFKTGRQPADATQVLSYCDEVGRFADSEIGGWAFACINAKRGVDEITSGLRLNLSALSVGEYEYRDKYNFGGALKFFGQVSGFESGLWGYTLKANGIGTVSLPITAQEGVISLAKFAFDFGDKSTLAATLRVFAADGSETVLSTDLDKISEGVAIPSTLKSSTLRVALTVKNKKNTESVVLGGARFHLVVK